ncbi:MAG: spermidine synthase, partial [bacterium]|nr:spermidine synthase [bacterium]
YSDAFYQLCARRLRTNGVLVTQATSPFFAREAFWCIVQTIDAAHSPELPESGMRALPYHVNVPSFGEWGFVMTGKRSIDPEQLSVSVPTRFLNTETLRTMFTFGNDIQTPEKKLNINRLEHPVLYTYYEKGWGTFND